MGELAKCMVSAVKTFKKPSKRTANKESVKDFKIHDLRGLYQKSRNKTTFNALLREHKEEIEETISNECVEIENQLVKIMRIRGELFANLWAV